MNLVWDSKQRDGKSYNVNVLETFLLFRRLHTQVTHYKVNLSVQQFLKQILSLHTSSLQLCRHDLLSCISSSLCPRVDSTSSSPSGWCTSSTIPSNNQ